MIREKGPAQLTDKQLSILLAIQELDGRLGYPPSMEEVMAATGCSKSGLFYQYKQLEAMGYLRRTPGQPRTVEARLPGEPSRSARRPAAGNGSDAPPAGGLSSSPEVAWVPEVGEVRAGPYVLAEQSIKRRMPLPVEVVGRDGTAFLLKITGDSMTGAGIMPGDWVVVRPLNGSSPRNGDIVVAIENNLETEATVKTYQKVGRQVWLLPHNPDYLPIPGGQASFAGKVVAVLRQVTPGRPARS